jgi:hypothetical protein
VDYVLPLWNKSRYLFGLCGRFRLLVVWILLGLRYDYDNLSKEEATKAITTTWRLDLILIIS